MRTHRTTVTMLLGAALFATAANAQVGPEQAIRKIAEEVEKEMGVIDRLLLESRRTKDSNQPAEQSAEQLRGLIDQTQESQGKVVRGIDQLIDELQNMTRQQSSSSSQQQQQQQDQQDQQQQQGGQPQDQQGQSDPRSGQQQQGTRREIDTPDLAQQGEQQGQQQQQQDQSGETQPQGQVPDSGRADPKDPGANRVGGQPKEGGTEQVERATDAERWGELQKYVPPQYQRAGVPEVPAKYRRLHEAFQKRANKRGTEGGR